MNEPRKDSLATLQFEGGQVEIMVTNANKDDAAVVFIDTAQGNGRVRINLNDAVVYDGDPDSHNHTMCTCTERSRR